MTNDEAPIAKHEVQPDIEKDNKETLLSNDQEEMAIPEDKPKVKKCCFVELNEGVTYFNLFTYYLVQFSYVCAFTFIDACQDYLLKSPQYYNIDFEHRGTVNGDILLFDTLYLVIIKLTRDCLYLRIWFIA